MASCSSRCKIIGSIGFLNREAMRVFNTSDSITAEFLLFQAQQLLLHVKGVSILEAKTINNLGLVQHSMGEYIKAQSSYRRSLSLIRERIGEDNSLYRAVEHNYRCCQDQQTDACLAFSGATAA